MLEGRNSSRFLFAVCFPTSVFPLWTLYEVINTSWIMDIKPRSNFSPRTKATSSYLKALCLCSKTSLTPLWDLYPEKKIIFSSYLWWGQAASSPQLSEEELCPVNNAISWTTISLVFSNLTNAPHLSEHSWSTTHTAQRICPLALFITHWAAHLVIQLAEYQLLIIFVFRDKGLLK